MSNWPLCVLQRRRGRVGLKKMSPGGQHWIIRQHRADAHGMPSQTPRRRCRCLGKTRWKSTARAEAAVQGSHPHTGPTSRSPRLGQRAELDVKASASLAWRPPTVTSMPAAQKGLRSPAANVSSGSSNATTTREMPDGIVASTHGGVFLFRWQHRSSVTSESCSPHRGLRRIGGLDRVAVASKPSGRSASVPAVCGLFSSSEKWGQARISNDKSVPVPFFPDLSNTFCVTPRHPSSCFPIKLNLRVHARHDGLAGEVGVGKVLRLQAFGARALGGMEHRPGTGTGNSSR